MCWRSCAQGVVIPAHPLALNAERKLDPRRQRALTRYYLDAGVGRARGRRPHHAVRDPRRRALPAGAGARDAHRGRMDAAAPSVMIAGVAGRTDAGGAGGADRARPRLPRGAAVARRHEGRQRGRADRACAGRRAGNAAGRLLPAARRRRHRAAGRRSGAASPRSTMSSRSRSRRSTAIARSTSCAASSRPARPNASRSTPATTITSCSTW